MVEIFLCKSENKVVNVFINESDAKNYCDKCKMKQACRSLLISNGEDPAKLDKIDARRSKIRLENMDRLGGMRDRKPYRHLLNRHPSITQEMIDVAVNALTTFVVETTIV